MHKIKQKNNQKKIKNYFKRTFNIYIQTIINNNKMPVKFNWVLKKQFNESKVCEDFKLDFLPKGELNY